MSRECSKEIKSVNNSITKKNYKEAISTLNKLLETVKNSISLRLSLARVLFETQKWDQLSDECVTIMKMQPDNLEALYMRGYALLESGDIDTANAHFKKVLCICVCVICSVYEVIQKTRNAKREAS